MNAGITAQGRCLGASRLKPYGRRANTDPRTRAALQAGVGGTHFPPELDLSIAPARTLAALPQELEAEWSSLFTPLQAGPACLGPACVGRLVHVASTAHGWRIGRVAAVREAEPTWRAPAATPSPQPQQAVDEGRAVASAHHDPSCVFLHTVVYFDGLAPVEEEVPLQETRCDVVGELVWAKVKGYPLWPAKVRGWPPSPHHRAGRSTTPALPSHPTRASACCTSGS